jgi:hypothetical protein
MGLKAPSNMIIRLYKIVATPGLITVGQSKSELAYVTLKAFEGDQPPRKLRIYERRLCDVFSQLTDLQRSAEMIVRLRNGCEVDLPGLYTARLLIELGFRKCLGD